MDKYLRKYEEKFGEQFPIMLCKGCDDEEIVEIIDECISKNEPYVVEHGDY